MESSYDLTIIGGGPGGYVAAIRAARLGLKTAIVEEGEMGGTCLNRGCIPTKALLHSAELFHQFGRAAEFGITASVRGFDYARMSGRKESIVTRLRSGVEALVRRGGATIIPGRARIAGEGRVEVSGATPALIRTGKTVIATGSRPSRPPIPGIDGPGTLDSDQVLALKDCPRRLVIIGGGVLGVEFATLFGLLGNEVAIVEMAGSLVPGLDLQVSGLLRKSLEAKGIKVFTGARVTGVSSGARVTCAFSVGEERLEVGGDAVIVATGRRPNVEDLGLETVGIALERGFIKVDGRMETSVRGIYAIGDVIGKWPLAHAASAQGIVAAENAAGRDRAMDHSIVPACIYSSPEIATVGLSEEAARAGGFDVGIGSFPVAANGKSMIMGEGEGLAKVVTDRGTGEILGVHLMGPRVTELIGEACVAMGLEATVEELSATIHPHPTVGEILMEAALDAEGRSLHRPR